MAEDYGGPRKEFFCMCLKAIKEKYFDDGLLPHLAKAYHTVGVIMGMFNFIVTVHVFTLVQLPVVHVQYVPTTSLYIFTTQLIIILTDLAYSTYITRY